VAEAAAGTPVVLYDIAFRTGRPITTDTLLSLARDVPNIVAVKDASRDIPQAAARGKSGEGRAGADRAGSGVRHYAVDETAFSATRRRWR